MSEVNATTSSQGPEASSQVEDKSNEVVAYDTFRKSVEQEKNARRRAAELEEKLNALELEKQQKDGNLVDVIDKLKNENAELRQSNGKKDKAYGWANLESAIKQQAIKDGCSNPDKLIRLLDKSDLSLVSLNENYQADPKDIAMLVNKAKSDNDFLFKSKSIPVADGIPNGRITMPDKLDVSKMSAAQLKDHILKQG